MAYEVSITKWHGGVLIDIEDREKVMIKYGTPGGSRAAALAQAIHESVKGVRLPKSVMDAVQAEYVANREKRMMIRELKKSGAYNGSGRKSPIKFDSLKKGKRS